MSILKKIKWAYQRIVRGYDDRICWDFEGYFNQFIPAIEKFCKEELLDVERMELNKIRANKYKHMLELIEDYKNMSIDDEFEKNNAEDKLWIYFAKNIGWFWN